VTLILITLHTTAYKTEEREQAVYLGENKECNCYKPVANIHCNFWPNFLSSGVRVRLF
jgi:hypothetical protein